jgi:glycogen debranching enzyme
MTVPAMRPDLASRAAPSVRTLPIDAGQPWPLGASWHPPGVAERGVQFAVWAPDATRIELCLFDASGQHELQRVALPACTDGVWHGRLDVDVHAADCVQGDALVYGYRAFGPWAPLHGHRFSPAKVLLDPYAHEVVGHYAGDLSLYVGHDVSHDPAEAGSPDVRDNAALALKACVRRQTPSPLAPPAAPRVARDEAVFYEVHVKGATRLHPDVPEALRGSYAGLAHPAMQAHLRALGVTTLSLLPVHVPMRRGCRAWG